jgi:orotate phosphoribosyltransferase
MAEIARSMNNSEGVASERESSSLLATREFAEVLGLDDEVLRHRLLGMLRRTGVKVRSHAVLQALRWPPKQRPRVATFWKLENSVAVPSTDNLFWDLREPLMEDDALTYCSILLYRRVRKYGVNWIGGVETAAIPITSSILTINRICGGPQLKGFYLRKERKPDGLRRILEGPSPPRGERVLLVDDLLNKGISKRRLVSYCLRNGLKPVGLLVVVNTERIGNQLFQGVCPVECLYTRSEILDGISKVQSPNERSSMLSECNAVSKLSDSNRLATIPGAFVSGATSRPKQITNHTSRVPSRPSLLPTGRMLDATEMTREDIELVRLARDTVIFTALSNGKQRPQVAEDERGTAGYTPFLGRYLTERGVVFTRLSKREYRDGRWQNRIRGCQAVGLLCQEPRTYSEMTQLSAAVSATHARKVKTGTATFHKPIWPEEIGAISVFVYVVEELIPTRSNSAKELSAEGHDIRNWGLIGQCEGYRGVICSDLESVANIESQISAVRRKMQNELGIQPQFGEKMSFIRMRGRWLWDPARPKTEFF